MDDSLSPVNPTPHNRNKLARKVTKVLRLRAAAGKRKEEADDVDNIRSSSYRYDDEGMDLNESIVAVKFEALLAKLFASVSLIKAAYAQLQLAQCSYNSDEIQSADHLIISEFILLCELKQSYFKKQFDFLPEKAIVSSEIQEQNSVIKTYEIISKKLQFQNLVRDSEINRLKAELIECENRSKVMKKKLNESDHFYILDNVDPSRLNPSHFVATLRYAISSIRSFVKMMINRMESAKWNLILAANTIYPGVVFSKNDHVCYAFESFVSEEMFSEFKNSCYSHEKVKELREMNVNETLTLRPNSTFGKFCKVKYLALIHPDMELLLCGDLTHRMVIEIGGFPDTKFFSLFAEMAKRVWLLHCLAYSFEPPVTVFRIGHGSRFSDVYMESVDDEAFVESGTEVKVAFTVIPGFQIRKTILQSRVYLN